MTGPLEGVITALGAVSLLGLCIALALILVLASVMRRMAQAVGLPGVLGEVVSGLLLGPSVLGHAAFASGDAPGGLGCGPAGPAGAAARKTLSACLFPTDVQDVLTAIGYGGLILFMFMMGLELDWEALRSRSHAVVTIAAGSALLPVALGATTALVLYGPALVPGWGTGTQPSKLAFALFFGALLTVPGGPIILRILQERGMLASKLGSLTGELVAALTVIGFTFWESPRRLRGAGGGSGSWRSSGSRCCSLPRSCGPYGGPCARSGGGSLPPVACPGDGSP